MDIPKKVLLKREVKVVNQLLQNDQINKSEKPFSAECNKVLETKNATNKPNKNMNSKDLMVLFENFYKLNGVKQHRLIEFLKDLEVTEPERVADLRKHVRANPPEEPMGSTNEDSDDIDAILNNIDSILDAEDAKLILKKNEDLEPASKRLKIEEDGDTSVPLGKRIPVQFTNCQNYSCNCNQNQNLDDYSNDAPLTQYSNFMEHHISYNPESQTYEFNENQYYQNNLQHDYQINETLTFMPDPNSQSQESNFQETENINYNFANPFEQYSQNDSHYENREFFQ